MRRLIGAGALLLALATTLSCRRPAPEGLQSHLPPGRIISLAPNLTEILFELGAGDEVVGVTNYCSYPPAALEKEKIGDFINPSVEKIVQLAPDLIVAEKWTSTKIASRLRGLSLRVVETTSPQSLQQIQQVILEVGAAVGRSAQAQQLVARMEEQVRVIEKAGQGLPRRPTFYVEIDLPSWTVGRPSFINEAIFICGGRNLFEDVERPALQASKETIIARNPEIILSFEASSQEIRGRPGWDRIRAVREEKIIDNLSRNLFSRGNHRLVDGMRELQNRLVEMLRPSSSRGPAERLRP